MFKARLLSLIMTAGAWLLSNAPCCAVSSITDHPTLQLWFHRELGRNLGYNNW